MERERQSSAHGLAACTANVGIGRDNAATSVTRSTLPAQPYVIKHVSQPLRRQIFKFWDSILDDEAAPEFDLSEAASRKFSLCPRTAERLHNHYTAHHLRLTRAWRSYTASADAMMRSADAELVRGDAA
jgi:hypothetical protein